MKRKVLATLTVFSLVLTMMFSVVATQNTSEAKNRWGGDDMDDWPLTISCDPDFPIIGPNVGETKEEYINQLQYDKGNRTVSLSVKNYSPKIVKIVKKKKSGAFPMFRVKGLKKGYAHIKVTIKIKYAQDGKKKYTWNIKKYPVGHND